MEERENKSIFREKSLDRISSPEELDQYIKIAPVRVWVLISGIIIFLLGVIVWGIFGSIDSRIKAVIKVEDGKSVCYIEEDNGSFVIDGMQIYLYDDETPYTLKNVNKGSIYISDDSILVHMLNKTTNEYDEKDEDVWAITADIDTQLSDGMYEAYVVTEKIEPYKYITN